MIARIRNGVLANAFDKLVIAVTQLTLVAVQASHWGLHLYGAWILLSTIPSFLAVGDFGFATAAGNKMTMFVARGDQEAAVETFQSAWCAILISTAGIGLTFFSAIWLAPSAIIGVIRGIPIIEVRLIVTLLSVYGISVLQGSIFFSAFKCDGKFATGAMWNALIIMWESSLVILVVYLAGSPTAAASALVAGRISGLVAQNLALRKTVPWLTVGLKRATLREIGVLLVPAGTVMLVPLAQALFLQGAAIAVGLAAGQGAVPAFTASRTLSRTGLQACWLFNAALMPEFSVARARGDNVSQTSIVLFTVAVSIVLLLPFAVLLGTLGPYIIRVWTRGVVHAPSDLLWLMAATVVVGGLWYPLSNLILAVNRHASYSYAYVILAVGCLPLAYFLSLHFGAAGAAAAMLVVDLGMLTVLVSIGTRELADVSDLRKALAVMSDGVTLRLSRLAGTSK
jgi:O-antigen/teichoic acid export membrane protein